MKIRKRFGKLTTAFSLVGLAIGFILLGIQILAKGNSEGTPIAGGVAGICLGTAFLYLALHYGRYAILKSQFKTSNSRYISFSNNCEL
jgi:hypothetical protein